MAEQLLTFQEAATRLHLSLPTIRREAGAGEFEVISAGPSGRAKRIPESSVDEYIAKRTSNGCVQKSANQETAGAV